MVSSISWSRTLTWPLRNAPWRIRLQGSTDASRRRVVCAAPSYWANHAAPNHPDDLAGHNCLVHPRPGSTFSSWSFTIEGRPVTVSRCGRSRCQRCGVLRQWALDGHGRRHAKRFGYPQGACLWRIVTALDTFVTSDANLYAVTAGSLSSLRVRTFIDFWRRIWSRTDLSGAALTTLLANPEKSCRHSSDCHRLDNARYPRAPETTAELLPSVWSAHGCERESR